MPYFPMDTGTETLQHHAEDGAAREARSMPPPPPTPPKSPPDGIRVKNRRKRYLDMHPEYFSPALELAGPLALFHAFHMRAHALLQL
jgi:hypothetical protein